MCDRHSAVPMTDAVQETRLRCHHPTVPLCEGRQSWYSLPSWLIQPMRSSCSLRRDRVPLGWCGGLGTASAHFSFLRGSNQLGALCPCLTSSAKFPFWKDGTSQPQARKWLLCSSVSPCLGSFQGVKGAGCQQGLHTPPC